MRSQADLHYTWHHQILEITGYSHVTASLSHTHTPLPYLASTLPSWPILTTALYSHLESISSLTQASSTNSSADSLGLLTSSHRKSNHINSTSRQHHAMASFRVQSGGDERLVIRFGHRIITVEWNQQARFKKKKKHPTVLHQILILSSLFGAWYFLNKQTTPTRSIDPLLLSNIWRDLECEFDCEYE